jgi:hypothetical protein
MQYKLLTANFLFLSFIATNALSCNFIEGSDYGIEVKNNSKFDIKCAKVRFLDFKRDFELDFKNVTSGSEKSIETVVAMIGEFYVPSKLELEGEDPKSFQIQVKKGIRDSVSRRYGRLVLVLNKNCEFELVGK